MNVRSFVFLVITLFCSNAYSASLMPITYLTFQEEDTSSSITINFIVEGQSESSYAYFDTVSREANKELYTNKIKGTFDTVKKVDRTYHHVKLDNLKANSTYYFMVGDSSIGFSKEYKFKTLPNDASPIRLMVGGDMSVNNKIIEVASGAMKTSPHVIVIGGDIAYANGKVEDEIKWINWFKKMNKIMFTHDGYLTPLILAIGNHETTVGAGVFFNKVPFFFKLFPQNGNKSYFVRKIGSNSIMLVLDTGHNISHRKQKDFIKSQLKKYQHLNHRIAVYHAPLYPNHRSDKEIWARRGRRHWLKYFDRYNLTVAFEHHDHTLKRTKVLKDNKVADKGTLYVGDGCWGKSARESNEKWYLEKSSGDSHVWLTNIETKSIELKAMGKDGEVYDHVKLSNSKLKTTVQAL